MSVLFFSLLAFSAILAAPAWCFARRDRRWFLSDYATVFAPIVLWFVLVILGIGPQSLSNIVEVMGMALFNPLILTVRVFILDRLGPDPASGRACAWGRLWPCPLSCG